MRKPSRTTNAERLTGARSKPEVSSTPSIPSPRRGDPVTLPCRNICDGRAVIGVLVVRTPDVPGERPKVISGRRFRSGVGKSRSPHKRRKARSVSTQGLPGLTGRREDEGYLHPQLAKREQTVSRRTQNLADDQTREDEASRKRCPGPRRSTGGIQFPPTFMFCVAPHRKGSEPAALAEHHT